MKFYHRETFGRGGTTCTRTRNQPSASSSKESFSTDNQLRTCRKRTVISKGKKEAEAIDRRDEGDVLERPHVLGDVNNGSHANGAIHKRDAFLQSNSQKSQSSSGRGSITKKKVSEVARRIVSKKAKSIALVSTSVTAVSGRGTDTRRHVGRQQLFAKVLKIADQERKVHAQEHTATGHALKSFLTKCQGDIATLNGKGNKAIKRSVKNLTREPKSTELRIKQPYNGGLSVKEPEPSIKNYQEGEFTSMSSGNADRTFESSQIDTVRHTDSKRVQKQENDVLHEDSKRIYNGSEQVINVLHSPEIPLECSTPNSLHEHSKCSSSSEKTNATQPNLTQRKALEDTYNKHNVERGKTLQSHHSLDLNTTRSDASGHASIHRGNKGLAGKPTVRSRNASQTPELKEEQAKSPDECLSGQVPGHRRNDFANDSDGRNIQVVVSPVVSDISDSVASSALSSTLTDDSGYETFSTNGTSGDQSSRQSSSRDHSNDMVGVADDPTSETKHPTEAAQSTPAFRGIFQAVRSLFNFHGPILDEKRSKKCDIGPDLSYRNEENSSLGGIASSSLMNHVRNTKRMIDCVSIGQDALFISASVNTSLDSFDETNSSCSQTPLNVLSKTLVFQAKSKDAVTTETETEDEFIEQSNSKKSEIDQSRATKNRQERRLLVSPSIRQTPFTRVSSNNIGPGMSPQTHCRTNSYTQIEFIEISADLGIELEICQRQHLAAKSPGVEFGQRNDTSYNANPPSTSFGCSTFTYMPIHKMHSFSGQSEPFITTKIDGFDDDHKTVRRCHSEVGGRFFCDVPICPAASKIKDIQSSMEKDCMSKNQKDSVSNFSVSEKQSIGDITPIRSNITDSRYACVEEEPSGNRTSVIEKDTSSESNVLTSFKSQLSQRGRKRNENPRSTSIYNETQSPGRLTSVASVRSRLSHHAGVVETSSDAANSPQSYGSKASFFQSSKITEDVNDELILFQENSLSFESNLRRALVSNRLNARSRSPESKTSREILPIFDAGKPPMVPRGRVLPKGQGNFAATQFEGDNLTGESPSEDMYSNPVEDQKPKGRGVAHGFRSSPKHRQRPTRSKQTSSLAGLFSVGGSNALSLSRPVNSLPMSLLCTAEEEVVVHKSKEPTKSQEIQGDYPRLLVVHSHSTVSVMTEDSGELQSDSIECELYPSLTLHATSSSKRNAHQEMFAKSVSG